MGIFPLGLFFFQQQTFNKEHTHENGDHSKGIQIYRIYKTLCLMPVSPATGGVGIATCLHQA